MRSARLYHEIVPVPDLGVVERNSMYALFAASYENVTREMFEADLREKDCAILLRDKQESALRGFSTQKLLNFRVDGQAMRAVFSGDTIIARSHWGEQELGHAWCQFAGDLYAEAPAAPLYWFLISKGYRTYSYLPLFFHHFWPRYDRPTPVREQKILDALATSRYPKYYLRERGLMVFPESHGNLNCELAEIPAHRLRNAHVRYFLAKNPGFAQGHELACIAEVSPGNVRNYASRMIFGRDEVAAGQEPSGAYA